MDRYLGPWSESAGGTATALRSPETAPAPHGSARPRRYAWLLEAVALLVSPPAAFFGLHVARMMPPSGIDSYLYTAYAQNGSDLIARYGDYRYFWVRVGFVLPARASYLAFGAVPGFYVLRYVLALVAVIPVYLLFRRLYGRAAGALAVAVALSSPVVLRTWGTDYPAAAAISYLFAGTACLSMPAASRRGRLLWVIVAGVCLSLAAHSHASSIPLIAAIVVAYAAVNLRRQPLDVLAHLGLLALCTLAVTGGLIMVAQQVFGSGDIIGPTVAEVGRLRTPQQIAIWHSTNWRWVLHDPYLLALPTVVAGWGVARLGRRPRVASPSELTVVVAVALQGLAFTWLQFFGNSQTLENHNYSSMLWPGICIVTALLLVALCAPLLRRPGAAAVPTALVVLIPLVVTRFKSWVHFDIPVGALVVAAVLALVLVSRLIPRKVVATAVIAGFVVSGCFALTIGRPVSTPLLPGQAKGFSAPQYDTVIGGDGRAELEAYRLASELHLVVPRARFRGDDLMMWYPSPENWRLNTITAQYLWHVNSLRRTMPDLLPRDRKLLRERRPGVLLLISETGTELPSALRSLSADSFNPIVLRKTVLTGASMRFHVWVVELRNFRPPARAPSAPLDPTQMSR
jgi:hypothetical protein